MGHLPHFVEKGRADRGELDKQFCAVSHFVHDAAVSRREPGERMADDQSDLQEELDQLQAAYKAAVDEWVATIREEEALASITRSVAELDEWEAAGFREDRKRREVIYKKRLYEDALRREFFGF